ALTTIRYEFEHNARLVLASHLGRQKGKPNPKYSLAPAASRLSKLLGLTVPLAPDCIGDQVHSMVESMSPGQALMLENVRFHVEEEKNDRDFAKRLAENAD